METSNVKKASQKRVARYLHPHQQAARFVEAEAPDSTSRKGLSLSATTSSDFFTHAISSLDFESFLESAFIRVSNSGRVGAEEVQKVLVTEEGKSLTRTSEQKERLLEVMEYALRIKNIVDSSQNGEKIL
jgi:hypothetical protein